MVSIYSRSDQMLQSLFLCSVLEDLAERTKYGFYRAGQYNDDSWRKGIFVGTWTGEGPLGYHYDLMHTGYEIAQNDVQFEESYRDYIRETIGMDVRCSVWYRSDGQRVILEFAESGVYASDLWVCIKDGEWRVLPKNEVIM